MIPVEIISSYPPAINVAGWKSQDFMILPSKPQFTSSSFQSAVFDSYISISSLIYALAIQHSYCTLPFIGDFLNETWLFTQVILTFTRGYIQKPLNPSTLYSNLTSLWKNHHFVREKSTISMAMFNSFVRVITRGYHHHFPMVFPYCFPMIFPFSDGFSDGFQDVPMKKMAKMAPQAAPPESDQHVLCTALGEDLNLLVTQVRRPREA